MMNLFTIKGEISYCHDIINIVVVRCSAIIADGEKTNIPSVKSVKV